MAALHWNSGSRSAHTPIKRINSHRDTLLCLYNLNRKWFSRHMPQNLSSALSCLHPGNHDTSHHKTTLMKESYKTSTGMVLTSKFREWSLVQFFTKDATTSYSKVGYVPAKLQYLGTLGMQWAGNSGIRMEVPLWGTFIRVPEFPARYMPTYITYQTNSTAKHYSNHFFRLVKSPFSHYFFKLLLQAGKLHFFGTRLNWVVSYIAYTKFHSPRPVFHSPGQIFTRIGERASASFPACVRFLFDFPS